MGRSDGCRKCRWPAKEGEIQGDREGDGATLCHHRSYTRNIENSPVRRREWAVRPIGMKCYTADTGWRRTAEGEDTFVYSARLLKDRFSPAN